MTRHRPRIDSLRLANAGFVSIRYALERGEWDIAREIADALHNLPSGEPDDGFREELTIANVLELFRLYPDHEGVRALRCHIPAREQLRPV